MLYHNWWRAYHHHVISICNLNRQEALPPCRPFIAPWQQRCAAKLHWASRTGRSISWLAKEHTPAKEVSLKSTTKPGIWSCSGQLGNWWKHHFSWIDARNRSRSHEFWADRRWSAMLSNRIYRIYDHPDLQHPRWRVHECCRSHWSAPRQRVRLLSASPETRKATESESRGSEDSKVTVMAIL